MNQADLRQLADDRIRDAEALLAGGRWSFAYYVAGYAVECALKSCVLARMIHTGWVFDEEVKRVDDCRTHEFRKLMAIAGIKGELDAALAASAAAGGEFATNWGLVDTWKVTSRYETKSEAEAKALYAAITDPVHGVMGWIRKYW